MAGRLRSRSSSLKTLPPEAPSSFIADLSLNGLSVSGGSSSSRPSPHWIVNDKDKLVAPKRPRQTVQLKHPKGAAASPTSSRPSSGVTDSSNEPLSERRSLPRKVSDSPQPRAGAHSSRTPQRSSEDAAAAASPGSRPLASTAPPSLGGSRPPLAPPRAPSCGDNGARDVASPQKRRSTRPVAVDEVASIRASTASGASPSSSSRAKAKVMGEHDTDGVIYRPAVASMPTPLPRGVHRLFQRPGSSGGNSRVSTPSLSLASSLARPGTASSAIPEEAVSMSFEEAGPPRRPRIAWTEGTVGEGGLPGPGVLDLAEQLRRELLAFRVEEGADDGREAPGGRLTTPDARQSFEDMEKSLAKASKRVESSRLELGGYLDDLQAKVFHPPMQGDSDAADKDEPLVALPADFDDVVDLNAQITSAQRRGASGSGEATPGGAKADSGFQLPSFLEKYFFEDKAVEQLPHRQLEDQEEQEKGGEETELQRGLRQIARLDGLLAKREAAGNARLKAAKAEFEATKGKLLSQVEEAKKNRALVLQKLREKGLIKGGAKDRSSLSTPTTTASSASSARGSTPESCCKLSLVEVSQKPLQDQASALVEWTGWTSSAFAEEPQPEAAPAALKPPESPAVGEQPEDHDTGTFLLTAMTGHLGSLSAKRQPEVAKAHVEAVLALATIKEGEKDVPDASHVTVADAEEEDEAPLPLPEPSPYADLESLEALRQIDERLQRLVPEAEWEAKSISSLPHTADGSSQPRSLWSSHGVPDAVSPLALPGEPELRERAAQRGASDALQAIEDRLGELRLEHSRPPESRPPDPEKLRKLLMEAAREAEPMDCEAKVKALTGGAVSDGALMPWTAPRVRLPDSAPLKEARQALHRLSGYAFDFQEAEREADSCWHELESEVQAFENATAASAAPHESSSQPPATSQEGGQLDPFASKLLLLEQELVALAEPQAGATRPPATPAEPMELSDNEDSGSEGEGGDVLLTFAAPSAIAAAPPAPEHALDIQLPADDGLWDDAELERVMRAMDAHYGDELPAFEFQEPDLSDGEPELPE